MLVLHWDDYSAWGPQIDFLACVQHMGEARDLAARAGAPAPDKRHRLGRKDVLFALAAEHPGVLLWKPSSEIRGEEAVADPVWRHGAEEAKAFRMEDADRYNQIQEAARERRKHRR